jgi:hypothetical protein
MVVDVRIIGGGLAVLPGTASSFEMASVRKVSVHVRCSAGGEKLSGDDLLGV